ncbi:MAG: HAMP domain-containing sensor histidine kinase [Myxococcota bacterium]|nr:HAMP domain-containing sensor histidine kinase [Myxococcota bacterium]
MNGLVDDPPRHLSQLVEKALVNELGRQFTESNQIGLRILDGDGTTMEHVAAHDTIWETLWGVSTLRPKLTAFIQRVKAHARATNSTPIIYDPIVGFAYYTAPLEYEFEPVGQIIIGPYVCGERAPRELSDLEDNEVRNALRQATFPPVFPRHEAVANWAHLLRKSLEVACHLGYRALLTKELHVDSIAEAYRKLETANRELEARNAALAANVARLRELDVLKSNFLATVSHELRTPLTSVIGYSEMLLEGLAGDLNEEQRDYVGTIMERGESLLSLIGNILDISRIQRGGVSLNLEYMSLENLVEGALATVRPQAFKRSIALDTAFEAHLPDTQIDAQKIHQVLVNLLGNAVKFTDSGGQVTVRMARRMMPSVGGPGAQAQEAVELSVQDTGIGIAPNQLNRIFDAFYQVDNGATRKYGGAGLGLSIVRNVVQAHGGRVQVKSRLGEGTNVLVTLPVHQSLTTGQE